MPTSETTISRPRLGSGCSPPPELGQHARQRGTRVSSSLTREPRPGGEQDLRGHLAERFVALVAVRTLPEIHLGERVKASEVEQVNQHGELNAVARHEWHPVQHFPPAGGFPGQWLHEAGEIGPEQVDQRPGAQQASTPVDDVDLNASTFYWDFYKRFFIDDAELVLGGGVAGARFADKLDHFSNKANYSGGGISVFGEGFYPLVRFKSTDIGFVVRGH